MTPIDSFKAGVAFGVSIYVFIKKNTYFGKKRGISNAKLSAGNSRWDCSFFGNGINTAQKTK
ncbi:MULTISPECIES: hypothetical protein [Bacillus]|uniref:Uncharacterized protein n=2 Tax=Bacillus TaxID=1386 RepID=A0A0M4FT22_9BACI|nr:MULTISPECIES: hypothetical protein [Bacillus]ALC83110.1 hypothetical protein AM592_17170 [Bacillus gobiensis]MBP1082167.1 hypothetical protein [Bacillus capparidis]MED1096781.1 hypothetical protein [Bacillus capparidis]